MSTNALRFRPRVRRARCARGRARGGDGANFDWGLQGENRSLRFPRALVENPAFDSRVRSLEHQPLPLRPFGAVRLTLLPSCPTALAEGHRQKYAILP